MALPQGCELCGPQALSFVRVALLAVSASCVYSLLSRVSPTYVSCILRAALVSARLICMVLFFFPHLDNDNMITNLENVN